jgi:cytochrome c biogenesis protein CcmG/thiol:disulfide interchange protein DsbE
MFTCKENDGYLSAYEPATHHDAKRRLLLLIVLAAIAIGTFVSRPVRANELVVGRPAPTLVLHTIDGHDVSTADLIGKVVIVTFWSTWCEPCHEELPLLSDYAAHHLHQGLQILGFSLDGPEDLARVRTVAGNLSFPVGLLGSPWAGDYGRIWRIPVSFVIDRSGRLVTNGWNDEQPVWTKERLQQLIDPLLAGKEG